MRPRRLPLPNRPGPSTPCHARSPALVDRPLRFRFRLALLFAFLFLDRLGSHACSLCRENTDPRDKKDEEENETYTQHRLVGKCTWAVAFTNQGKPLYQGR